MEAQSSTQQKVNLENFNLQELMNMRKRLEDDVTTILDSYNGFKFLYKKFEDAKILIKNVSQQKADDCQILIPLSSSLFIPGKIVDTNKFIVDIGTGYYAERNAEQSVVYCDHTLQVIKENGDKMAREINKKQELRDQVNIEIHKKYSQRNEATKPGADDFKKKAN
jgi:prefoldin alpha subunit